MPIYSYKCENCGYHFDQFQHFTDDPLTFCPNCNTVALRKVYQPVGIVFKGSGFYSTDHRSPSGQSYTHPKEEAASTAKAEPAKTAEKSSSGEAGNKSNGSSAAE